MKLQKISHLQTYPIRHSVMWPNQPIDYIKINGDEDALHFGIEEDGSIQSIVSLFIENDSAQLRKLATVTKYRNRSYASKLINHCIDHCRELLLNTIWLNARKDKTAFYRKFGFIATEQIFNKGGIDYVIMELRLR